MIDAETREWIVANLTLQRSSQRSDLLDPNLTTNDLLDFLLQLLHVRGGAWQNGRIVITAVRSDHPTWDGPDGHSGGNAIDLADNAGAPAHLLADVQSCSAAKGIGCAGPYRDFAAELGGYSEASKLFEDNATNHLHVQVRGY